MKNKNTGIIYVKSCAPTDSLASKSGLRPEKEALSNPHSPARPKDLVHWPFNKQP